MVTIESYLAKVRVGSTVTDKRTLAALKKNGYISGYSKWGFLEPFWVYRRGADGFVMKVMEWFGTAPEKGARGSEEDPLREGERYVKPVFEYKGCRFSVRMEGSEAYLVYLGMAAVRSEAV